jgi:hypothetical protein
MKKYLIEVPHGDDKTSCLQAIQVFQQTGSHFLTHAQWGCVDGEHKAWILLETENKDEALNIVPPAYRSFAKVIELSSFAEDMLDPEKYHKF